MGITERREREKEEIRQKILDAARDLFTRDGYDRVTMRGIAEAIEYSPTTIYHHFEDKDDVVRSLCELDFARLLGALASEKPAEDPVEQIRRLGLAYARFGLENPNHYRFMFMTPGKLETPQDHSESGLQSFGLLRGAVERAVAAGRLRSGDPDTMAQVLWASLHGVVALLITLPPEHWPTAEARPDLVEQVVENGIRGFLPE